MEQLDLGLTCHSELYDHDPGTSWACHMHCHMYVCLLPMVETGSGNVFNHFLYYIILLPV